MKIIWSQYIRDLISSQFFLVKYDTVVVTTKFSEKGGGGGVYMQPVLKFVDRVMQW